MKLSDTGMTTQQNILPREEVNIAGCVRCGNYLASDANTCGRQPVTAVQNGG